MAAPISESADQIVIAEPANYYSMLYDQYSLPDGLYWAAK